MKFNNFAQIVAKCNLQFGWKFFTTQSNFMLEVTDAIFNVIRECYTKLTNIHVNDENDDKHFEITEKKYRLKYDRKSISHTRPPIEW